MTQQTDFITTHGRSDGLRCCVVTPIGPGHDRLYPACRDSVLRAFAHDPGPFDGIVLAGMDDREGRHGRSQRRNEGIRIALQQGAQWVFFLDADDLMLEDAFRQFAPYEAQYDAVWGAICEQLPGGQAQLRPAQPLRIATLAGLLTADPMCAVQMGHFVRTDVAREQGFDTRMDVGEDYKYYLGLWKQRRCIKIDAPLFLNRRGMHSAGPRSAVGSEWTRTVARLLVDFRIANAGLIEQQMPAASRQDRHIVVTGFSRSGTTMFYSMLRSAVRRFEFLDREFPAAHLVGHAGRRIISKRPLDLFDIDNICKARHPGKRLDFIIVIRDVRGILTSRHASVPDDYFISHDAQYFIPSQGRPERRLPGVVDTYQAIRRLLSSDISAGKVVVRYEDLIREVERSQESLAAQLRLSFGGRFQDFHRHAVPEALSGPLNRIAAPDEQRIRNWQKPEHRERIRQQFTACPELFDILVQTGYEKDRRWFEAFERNDA